MGDPRPHPWPIHPPPYDDELLSSWLVRLAQANAIGIHDFCAIAWPGLNVLRRDLDRGLPDMVLRDLATRARLSLARVRATTLASWEGHLVDHWDLTTGKVPWVLPLARGRRARGGLQFCPDCLREGRHLYFRRSWRLAWVTLCLRHGGRPLNDVCCACKEPVSLVEAWEKRWMEHQLPLTQCRRCGLDLRGPFRGRWRGRLDRRLVAFQADLERTLERGWCEVPGRGPVYSHLFFAGLRQILWLLGGRRGGRALREVILASMGDEAPHLARAYSSRGVLFELRGLRERQALLSMAAWLLEGWPDRFVQVCRMAKITSSRLVEDARSEAPYWYWEVVRRDLCGRAARWRNSGDTPRVGLSYRVLGLRRCSKRLAAREARVQFVREHPELWGDRQQLAVAMKAARLYGAGTHLACIRLACLKLLASAQGPEPWWKHR